jgi:hypothetical protein
MKLKIIILFYLPCLIGCNHENRYKNSSQKKIIEEKKVLNLEELFNPKREIILNFGFDYNSDSITLFSSEKKILYQDRLTTKWSIGSASTFCLPNIIEKYYIKCNNSKLYEIITDTSNRYIEITKNSQNKLIINFSNQIRIMD